MTLGRAVAKTAKTAKSALPNANTTHSLITGSRALERPAARFEGTTRLLNIEKYEGSSGRDKTKGRKSKEDVKGHNRNDQTPDKKPTLGKITADRVGKAYKTLREIDAELKAKPDGPRVKELMTSALLAAFPNLGSGKQLEQVTEPTLMLVPDERTNPKGYAESTKRNAELNAAHQSAIARNKKREANVAKLPHAINLLADALTRLPQGKNQAQFPVINLLKQLMSSPIMVVGQWDALATCDLLTQIIDDLVATNDGTAGDLERLAANRFRLIEDVLGRDKPLDEALKQILKADYSALLIKRREASETSSTTPLPVEQRREATESAHRLADDRYDLIIANRQLVKAGIGHRKLNPRTWFRGPITFNRGAGAMLKDGELVKALKAASNRGAVKDIVLQFVHTAILESRTLRQEHDALGLHPTQLYAVSKIEPKSPTPQSGTSASNNEALPGSNTGDLPENKKKQSRQDEQETRRNAAIAAYVEFMRNPLEQLGISNEMLKSVGLRDVDIANIDKTVKGWVDVGLRSFEDVQGAHAALNSQAPKVISDISKASHKNTLQKQLADRLRGRTSNMLETVPLKTELSEARFVATELIEDLIELTVDADTKQKLGLTDRDKARQLRDAFMRASRGNGGEKKASSEVETLRAAISTGYASLPNDRKKSVAQIIDFASILVNIPDGERTFPVQINAEPKLFYDMNSDAAKDEAQRTRKSWRINETDFAVHKTDLEFDENFVAQIDRLHNDVRANLAIPGAVPTARETASGTIPKSERDAILAQIGTIQENGKFSLLVSRQFKGDSGSIQLANDPFYVRGRLGVNRENRFLVEGWRKDDAFCITSIVQVRPAFHAGIGGTKNDGVVKVMGGGDIGIEGQYRGASGYVVSFAASDEGRAVMADFVDHMCSGESISAVELARAIDVGKISESTWGAQLSLFIGFDISVLKEFDEGDLKYDQLGGSLGFNLKGSMTVSRKSTVIESGTKTDIRTDQTRALDGTVAAGLQTHFWEPLTSLFAEGLKSSKLEDHSKNDDNLRSAKKEGDARFPARRTAPETVIGYKGTAQSAISKKTRRIRDRDGHYTLATKIFQTTTRPTKGATAKEAFERGLKSLMLPCMERLLDDAQQNQELLRKLDSAMRIFSPGDSVAMFYSLDTAVFEHVNGLVDQVQALRGVGNKRLARKVEKEIASILNDDNNYVPQKFTVVSTKRKVEANPPIGARLMTLGVAYEGGTEHLMTLVDLTTPGAKAQPVRPQQATASPELNSAVSFETGQPQPSSSIPEGVSSASTQQGSPGAPSQPGQPVASSSGPQKKVDTNSFVENGK